MRIVVIGGTGPVAAKLVDTLNEHGHDATVAGADTVTGAGLREVLSGAETVIDVSDTTPFGLLAAGADVGVAHHVALSIVNVDKIATKSAHFAGKLLQEVSIRGGGRAYSIVRSTLFFELVREIADAATQGDWVHLAPLLVQPVAAADVAEALAITAVNPPLNAVIDVGGPRQYRLDELVRTALTARGDRRRVRTDPEARFLGARLDERALLPGADAYLFDSHFEGWLLESIAQK